MTGRDRTTRGAVPGEMTAETWQRVEAVFEQVVERPPEERAEALERACGDDSEVRRNVEILLRCDEKGGSFLENMIGEGVELLETMGPTGRRIGPYRLLRRIGHGGMGEVYLASRDDEEYTKTVAIKLVRPGYESDQVHERFRRERQILANLEHPHIARMLDGGTTQEGKPYFVMESIEGESIDRYCDRQRLDLRGRLKLFCTVCDAVQFAHQSLIVHRDLKPSNILITADGVVKLLDFGIAKLLAPDDDALDAELTLTVERPLTLSYASPEQIRSERITAASDVYALGCLLYELLSGRRPFDLGGKTRRQAEQIILEEAPVPPSIALARWQREEPATAEAAADSRRARPETLRRRLTGELDTLVLAALRKDRLRRTGSAAELADDVHRYLRGLPIRAHRNSMGYRARKFARRNRLPLAVAALFLLVIAGAFFNNLQQTWRVERERDKAVAVTEYLVGLFNTYEETRGSSQAVTARDLVDKGAEAIEQGLDSQPQVRATLNHTIGRLYFQLGFYDRARELVERALEIRRRDLGDLSSEVAQSLNLLGGIEHAVGDHEAAERLHLEALLIYRQLFGDHDAGIAEATNDLALALRYQDRPEEAEERLRVALRLYESLYDGDHRSVARCLSNLSLVLADRGEHESATAQARRALEMARRLYKEPHLEVAKLMNNLASQLNGLGDFEEARPLFEQALAMHRQLLEPGHPDLVRSLNNLAALADKTGDFSRAEVLLREVVETMRGDLERGDPEALLFLTNLAGTLQRQEKYLEAEELFRQALRIRREVSAEDRDVADSLNRLASLLVTVNDYEEAEPLYEQALDLRRRIYGNEHPKVATTLYGLARLHFSRADFGAALVVQEECLAIYLGFYGDDHPNVARSRALLAEIHAASGDLVTALDLYRQAEKVQRRVLGSRHPHLASSLTGQGDVLTRLGRLNEAEATIMEALDIERGSDLGSWQLARTHSVLGGCRTAQGRYNEAEALLLEGHKQLEARRGSRHYATRAARARLAVLYKAWGRGREAARWQSAPTQGSHGSRE